MRWQLRAVSSESKALLDLALALVATDGLDEGPEGFRYTSSRAFKEDWIEKRAEYHDTHQAAYAEGFTAFHSRIAAEKAGVWTGGEDGQPRPFADNYAEGDWHVMFECTHSACSKTHPWPFRSPNCETVAEHMAGQHGQMVSEPRRVVVKGRGPSSPARFDPRGDGSEARARIAARKGSAVSGGSGGAGSRAAANGMLGLNAK